MIEREKEIAALRTVLQDATQGRGGVAVVSGPVASGKTELLHTFAQCSADSGALVLSATASRAEQSMPFEVMAQLFQPVSQSEESRRWTSGLISPEMCGKALAESDGTAAEKSSAQVMQALWMILTNLAADRPVVIVVDDLQHVDELSRDCLLYLARRLRFSRALMVLTEQTGPQHRYQAFHADLLRQPHCKRIKLAPLSEDGVRELLRERVGEERAARLAPKAHELTGGNPLLVNAVLEDHLTGVADGSGDLLLGDAFGEAVLSCLHRGDPLLLEVTRAVAVLGGAGGTELISAVLDTSAETAAQHVQALNGIGVLSHWQFRHPAAARAVLDHVTVEERSRMHVRAATLLQQDGSPNETVARHLLAAGAPLPPWAVEVLRDAAEQALFGDQTTTAVAYLELASSICVDEQERGAIMALLTSIEWQLDPSTASRHLPRLISSVWQRQLDQQHAMTMLRYLLWHGRFDEAEETMYHLDRLPVQGDPVRAAEIEFLRMWLAYSYPPLAARFARPAAVERTVPVALSTSPQHQAANVLATILSGRVDDQLVAKAEQLLQSCQLRDSTLEPLTTVLTALVYADRIPLAAQWCDSLLGEASARRAPTWQAVLSSSRAEISLRQGDLPAAAEHARTALASVSQERWGPSIGSPLASQLLAATEMGDFGEAARVLAQPVPNSTYESRYGLYYLHARGHYYLATGRPHAALNDFQVCGDLMVKWSVDLPELVPWRLDVAEVHLRVNNRDQAVAHVEDQLARIPTTPSRTRGMALRLLAEAGDVDSRPRLLAEACDVLQTVGARLELAKALTDLSEVHNTTGELDRARMVARRASSMAKACHAEPLLERGSSRQVEQHFAGRPDVIEISGAGGTSTLSDAERRVATLAAQGYTNRQIARRLFITVSTVEQHLTRAYRKLNVNRRTDLPIDIEVMTVDSA